MHILCRHYPEYLMEAAGLGIFMTSASVVTVIVEHPASSIRQVIADPFLLRLIIGVVMGLTAIAIIYSPWGKQSGAHINPAVTFTFFRLGKINRLDAFFYVVAQCVGGLLGVCGRSFKRNNCSFYGELCSDTSWFRWCWSRFSRRTIHFIWLNDDDFDCL